VAKLTEKQKRFVDEYLIDLNATQAAIRAGYSEGSAGTIGSENLQKPEIASRVNKAIAKRSKRVEISADRVLKELARIAFADVSDIADFGPNGVTLRPADEVDPHDLHCISEIGEKPMKDGVAVYLKTWDKIAALRELEKHLGICVDKKEVDLRGKLSFEDIIELAEQGSDDASDPDSEPNGS